MTLDQWWQVVEQARAAVADPDDSTAVAEEVRRRLARGGPAQIVAFCQPMNELMADSYLVDLLGAAYAINGGASEDGFEYFRGWLLTQGRRAFEQAVSNPDTLADLPAVRAAYSEGVDLECQDMLNSAWDAYREVTGQDLPSDAYTDVPRELGRFWDFEDEEEFSDRLPRLAALCNG